MASIEEKLKFLLKKAKLQGFVGISEVKDVSQDADDEKFLLDSLQKNGIEINHFLLTPNKNYKTVSYSAKKENKFLLTTRIDEKGDTFLLNKDSEKELFEKMINARNKMLHFAFSSIYVQEYLRKFAKKVENGTIKISNIINYSKDKTNEEIEADKIKFYETIKKLDTATKEQAVDLLFSLDLNEKSKGAIYRKFIETPDYTTEIKNELYEIEQIYSFAKREIIEANIRLVFSIAKEYSIVHKGILDISDIIQEGNIGLIEAVESFDCTKGNKFSSWAVWYIRRQIWAAVNSFKKFVYVPPKASNDLYKILRFEENYRARTGENPSIQEIAEEFNMKEKQVLSLLATDFGDVNSNYEFNVTDIDSKDDLDDFNEDSTNPFNAMAASGLKKNINDLLSKIGDRECKIIKLYFGLEDNNERLNLAQIGEIFGISRERVRQIIEKTIENMKELSAETIEEWK